MDLTNNTAAMLTRHPEVTRYGVFRPRFCGECFSRWLTLGGVAAGWRQIGVKYSSTLHNSCDVQGCGNDAKYQEHQTISEIDEHGDDEVDGLPS